MPRRASNPLFTPSDAYRAKLCALAKLQLSGGSPYPVQRSFASNLASALGNSMSFRTHIPVTLAKLRFMDPKP